MNQLRFSVTLLLCAVVHFSPALGCDWVGYEKQGLDLDYLGESESEIVDVDSPESCQEKCCSNPNCNTAVVGYPMDGPPQCRLLKCGDNCRRRENTQFSVYQKNGTETTLMTESKERNNKNRDVNCRLPPKVGLCRASFQRFYYDVTAGTCKGFVYGGCGANANNFKNIEECEAACSGVTGPVLPEDSTPPPKHSVKESRDAPVTADELDVAVEAQVKEMSANEYSQHCEVEPDVGPCRASFSNWYYNSKMGECQQFTYGGCQGNKNNYRTKESCESTCTVSFIPSFKNSDDDEVSTEYKEKCMVSPDVGPCRAAFLNFYFDYQSGSCQSFLYGGCQGNGNRYSSMDECMTQCSLDGPFFRHNQARSRWTAAFFLFVTLAAISALLLLALILISLRRRRLSRRSSLSDKEELLPDEQSSVESLTLPPSPQI